MPWAFCVLLLQTLLPSIVTQQHLLPSCPSGRIRVCRSSPLLCAGDFPSVPSCPLISCWPPVQPQRPCFRASPPLPSFSRQALAAGLPAGPPTGLCLSCYPCPRPDLCLPSRPPCPQGDVRPSLSLTAPTFACRFLWLSYPSPTRGELCSWRRSHGDDCTPPCSCPRLGPPIGRKRYFHGRKRHS